MTFGDALVAAIAFVAFTYEMLALARSTDRYQPYTYYVRRAIRRPVAWASLFAFWAWLGYHFFWVKS